MVLLENTFKQKSFLVTEHFVVFNLNDTIKRNAFPYKSL